METKTELTRWGNKVIMTSTPSSERTPFYDFFQKTLGERLKLYPYQQFYEKMASAWDNDRLVLINYGRSVGKSTMGKVYAEYLFYISFYKWYKKFKKNRKKFYSKNKKRLKL